MQFFIIFASILPSLLAFPRPSSPPGDSTSNPLLPYLQPEVGQYQKLVRPYYKGDPVNVTVNLYIRDLEPIVNIDKEELTMQLTFRQMWNDPRLRHESSEEFITMVGDETMKIWLPDTFFRQSRSTSTHGIMHTEQYARVFTTGDVLLSSRLTTTLFCPGIRTSWITFGNASCSFHIASYAFRTDDILYHLQEVDPVQVSRTVPVHTVVSDHMDIKTATGTYSVVTIDLTVVSKMYLKMAKKNATLATKVVVTGG